MRKTLDTLRAEPYWTSIIGCTKGCSDFYGLGISTPWLFGASAHAFIINIHDVLCPSGPTAWNSDFLFALLRNTGISQEILFATKEDEEFAEKQKRAFKRVREAIDSGVAVYGWELDIPEYYVIYGYTDDCYLYRGLCGQPDGETHYSELGDTDIGFMMISLVTPQGHAEPRQTVKKALERALYFATSPADIVMPQYRAGLDAYDVWIASMKSGAATTFGISYNANVWSECRKNAALFLREAAIRTATAQSSFEEAALIYEKIGLALERVATEYPFEMQLKNPHRVSDDANNRATISALNDAKNAEAKGLSLLKHLFESL